MNAVPPILEGALAPIDAASPMAIQTTDLNLVLGRKPVLSDVSLNLPVGGAYLLAGANGAGKTSLIGVLLNSLALTSGEVTIFGQDTRRRGAAGRALIGYVPETARLSHPSLRVRDLIDHVAAFRPGWDNAYADRLAKLLDIPTRERAGDLSKGQARRVQLLCALAHRPPLLLLDEPTDGLDPVARDDVVGLLADHLADTNGTLLIATHTVSEVERLVDQIGVMTSGRMIAQLPTATLTQRLRAYTADGPDGWNAALTLKGVLRREDRGRQVRAVVWGDPAEVRGGLQQAGGAVRDDQPLSLGDALVALLRQDIQA